MVGPSRGTGANNSAVSAKILIHSPELFALPPPHPSLLFFHSL